MIRKIIFGMLLFFSPFALADEGYYDASELTVREGKLYDNAGELVNGIVAFKMKPKSDLFLPYRGGEISDGSLMVKDKSGKVLSNWEMKGGMVVSGFNAIDEKEVPLTGSDLNAATVLAQAIFRGIPTLFGSTVKDEKQYPLYQAADIGDLDKVEELVEAGADVNYVCDVQCQGWTPLMIAAANGHERVVHYLLEKGANPNSQNRFGRTALHYVAKYNFWFIAKDLLEHGANPNLESINDVVNTPVKSALREGHTDMLRLLLEHGGDKTVIVNGFSIMDLANKKNAIELKKMLQ